MEKAPQIDDTDGATVGQVLSGKKYWGLRTGSWALKTGTATLIFKTGQTTSYATGDDGDLEKGMAHASPRFTLNVNSGNDDGSGVGTASNGICDGSEICNGTVTDNSTGLIWLTNANCASATRTWTTALSDIVQLNTDGKINTNTCGDISNAGVNQTDWRLPNRPELESLYDLANLNPVLPTGHPFTSVENNWYWSSTAVASNPTYFAWGVTLSKGDAQGRNITSEPCYVWAVRGGQ